MEEIDNFIVVSFNYTDSSVYSLINKISAAIRHPFKIIDYFADSDSNDRFSYALYLAQLSYFDTYVFLLKNFKWLNPENSLFDDYPNEMKSLIELNPPKMYIMMIISNEIKNLQDVERFIQASSLSIKLELINQNKLKSRLYASIEKYLVKSDTSY
ncbi:MAG: hypothetical protein KatS3mg027_0505 [Bacteroidia bacterium]|nr:MAG: hypothetical protein KatS3mg027_0505 [Bacteroidia bacterium]